MKQKKSGKEKQLIIVFRVGWDGHSRTQESFPITWPPRETGLVENLTSFKENQQITPADYLS